MNSSILSSPISYIWYTYTQLLVFHLLYPISNINVIDIYLAVKSCIVIEVAKRTSNCALHTTSKHPVILEYLTEVNGNTLFISN